MAFFTVDRRPGVFAGVFILISPSSSFLATEDFRGFRAGVFVREIAAIGASFSEKKVEMGHNFAPGYGPHDKALIIWL